MAVLYLLQAVLIYTTAVAVAQDIMVVPAVETYLEVEVELQQQEA